MTGEQAEQAVDVYCDGWNATFSALGHAVTFTLSGPRLGAPGEPSPPRKVAVVRMSPEAAKLLVIALAHGIKNWERQYGVAAQVPSQVLNQSNIALEDWNFFWKL